MALTISNQSFAALQNKRAVFCDLAFDSSYPTGGEALTPGNIGLTAIERVLFEPKSGYLFEYDHTNQKVKVFSGGGVDITPAGTFAGSALANHSHTLSGYAHLDANGVVAPTIALTHNAGPQANLAAQPIYAVEGGDGTLNVLTLYSTTNANTSVFGETADGTVFGAAASARFWINDTDTPAGVQLYINEAQSDRLEFVSPTATDGYIVMPMEGGYGFALRVKVTHSATAASGKALFFDDNGAADAQLIFVDTGTTGGTVPVTSISTIKAGYINQGTAGAGSATATSAGTPAGTFTGTAVAAGAAEEVDAATNLATLTAVKCVFIGY